MTSIDEQEDKFCYSECDDTDDDTSEGACTTCKTITAFIFFHRLSDVRSRGGDWKGENKQTEGGVSCEDARLFRRLSGLSFRDWYQDGTCRSPDTMGLQTYISVPQSVVIQRATMSHYLGSTRTQGTMSATPVSSIERTFPRPVKVVCTPMGIRFDNGKVSFKVQVRVTPIDALQMETDEWSTSQPWCQNVLRT